MLSVHLGPTASGVISGFPMPAISTVPSSGISCPRESFRSSSRPSQRVEESGNSFISRVIYLPTGLPRASEPFLFVISITDARQSSLLYSEKSHRQAARRGAFHAVLLQDLFLLSYYHRYYFYLSVNLYAK